MQKSLNYIIFKSDQTRILSRYNKTKGNVRETSINLAPIVIK